MSAVVTPVVDDGSIVSHDQCPCKASSGFWCNQMKLCVATYIVANTLCIVVLKLINYRYEFILPMLWAMLAETTWIVSFPLLYGFRRIHGRRSTFSICPSWPMLACCAGVGFGFTLSKTAISYSENVLPGSIYAIITSLDILFTGTFTRLVYGKHFTRANIFAIILVIGGVLPNAITSVIVAAKHRDASDKAIAITGLSLVIAIPVAIFGSAEQSLSTVISSYILKRTLYKQRSIVPLSAGSILSEDPTLSPDECSNNVLFIIQYSSWVSLFAFLGMSIPLYISGEALLWGPTLSSCWTGVGTIKHPGYDAVTGISIAAFVTVLTRMYMRFGKYYICSLRSAFTFSVVKPLPRILQVLVLCFVLGEVITWLKVLGMILTTIGMIVHVRGEQKEVREAHAARVHSPCRCPDRATRTTTSDQPLSEPLIGFEEP